MNRPASVLKIRSYDKCPGTVAFIGAGPGSVLTAAALVDSGALNPEQITFFDPKGKPGGIWDEPFVQPGGINNPAVINFHSRHGRIQLDPTKSRSSSQMTEFISSVYGHFFDPSQIKAKTIDNIERSSSQWLLDFDYQTQHFDAVVSSTGATEPRSMEELRIIIHDERSDKKTFYYQRYLQAELTQDYALPVTVGLGNSALTHMAEDTFSGAVGRGIRGLVATDIDPESLRFPMIGRNGRKPIFRTPSTGYLTGLAAEFQSYRIAYEAYLLANRLRGGITEIHLDDDSSIFVDKEGEQRFGPATSLNILAGYKLSEKNAGLLGKFLKNDNLRNLHPTYGSVYLGVHSYNSGLYCIGTQRSIYDGNPNGATVPGIIGNIPPLVNSLTTYLRYREL